MVRIDVLCIMMLLGVTGYSQKVIEESCILGGKKYTHKYVWEDGKLRSATFSEEMRSGKKEDKLPEGVEYFAGIDEYNREMEKYRGRDNTDYIGIEDIGISIDSKVVCNIYNAMRGYYKKYYGIYLPVGYYRDTMYYPMHIEFIKDKMVKRRGNDLLGDESGVLGYWGGVYIRLWSKDIMDWYDGSTTKDNIWYSYYLKSGYNSDAGYYLSLVVMHEIFHSFGLSDTDAGIMKGVKSTDYVDGRYNKTSWEEIESTIWEIENDLLSYHLRKFSYKPWHHLSFSNTKGVSPEVGDTLYNKFIGKDYKFILK